MKRDVQVLERFTNLRGASEGINESIKELRVSVRVRVRVSCKVPGVN